MNDTESAVDYAHRRLRESQDVNLALKARLTAADLLASEVEDHDCTHDIYGGREPLLAACAAYRATKAKP